MWRVETYMLSRDVARSVAVLVSIVVLLLLGAGEPSASPYMFGTADTQTKLKKAETQKLIDGMGLGVNVNDAVIVNIGSGFSVDEDEVIEGDIVIIGGGLTVEGKVEGDAVVIGGSMYLAGTSQIAGDAVVVGGIMEREKGAVVLGKILENPEGKYHLEQIKALEEAQTKHAELEREHAEAQKEAEEAERKAELAAEKAERVRIRIDVDEDDEEDEGPDLVKFGEDIYVAEDEVIAGDLVAIGGDIKIDGTVEGDVVATGGDIAIGASATVLGDIVSVMGDVDIEHGATIEGEVKQNVIEIDVGEDMTFRGKKSDLLTPGENKIRYRASLYAPEAKEVILTGTFNNWDPDDLRLEKQEDGTFVIYVWHEPGEYLYKFIVDGVWMNDPEVDLKVPDGMGDWATPLSVKGPGKKETVKIRFSLVRPEAEDVRVTGTFNGWDPEGVKMTKSEEGKWSVVLPLAPGRHLYKFYIDGEWGPDPDVEEQVPDGKGGFATQFVVKPPTKAKKVGIVSKVGKREGSIFAPGFDYNRVDGCYFAFVGKNETNLFPSPRFNLEGGYSKKRDRWIYSFELEQPIVGPFALSLGGSIYDKTDTYDKEIVSDLENLLSASFVKRDYRDYFDRRGAASFVAVRPIEHHMIKVGYSSDEYRPLETKAHTALFRRDAEFAPNPRNSYQICYNPDPAIEDFTCDMIGVKAVSATYEFDSRDCCQAPATGLLIRLTGEWAGDDVGGDLEYKRYVADVRHYKRIASKQKVAFRVKAGAMDVPDEQKCQCVPEPQYFFPKQFYVGGIGTLPGYGYKEYKGTNMILANMEYTYLVKDKLGLVFFANGGDARGMGESAGDVWGDMKLKFDAGVGMRIEEMGDSPLTISVVQRLDDLDRALLVSLRASRTF